MVENWVATVRADLDHTEDSRAYQARLEQARFDLLAAPVLVRDLIEAFVAEPDSESLAALLEMALDNGRMARENGEAPGAVILREAEDAVGTLLSVGEPGLKIRLAMSRVYVRAGLRVPEALGLQEDEHGMVVVDDDGVDLTGDGVPADPEEIISGLLDGVDEPLQAHAEISELFGALPAGPREMMAEMIAVRPGNTGVRLGCYWLLDPDRGLAAAALRGLEARLRAGGMDAADLGDLVRLRPWLPSDPVRADLDGLIRNGLRAELSGGTVTTGVKVHKVLASLPDGAGAQSIAVAIQIGSRRLLAMMMLKQGHGVKDAFIVPCSSASEQKRILGEVTGEINAIEIASWYLPLALGSALAEGVLPAPGLIDVTEVLGLSDIRPQQFSIDEVLAEADTHGMLGKTSPQRLTRLGNMCVDAMYHHPMTELWFENAADFEAILSTPAAPDKIERKLWRYLATRRSWWAQQCTVAAATLSAAGDTDWLGFAGTALLLDGKRDLKKIPLMHSILERSVNGPAPQIGVEAIAKALGHEPEWLEGYLTAAALSPGSLAPMDWLEPLLGGFREPPPMEVLELILDTLREEFNEAHERTDDETAVRAWLTELDAEGLIEWCTGFQSFITAVPRAWPKRGRRKVDKTALELIAKGREPKQLRAMLPEWLASFM